MDVEKKHKGKFEEKQLKNEKAYQKNTIYFISQFLSF